LTKRVKELWRQGVDNYIHTLRSVLTALQVIDTIEVAEDPLSPQSGCLATWTSWRNQYWGMYLETIDRTKSGDWSQGKGRKIRRIN
jgi:hypothetical protein